MPAPSMQLRKCHNHSLLVPYARANYFQHSFTPGACRFWNTTFNLFNAKPCSHLKDIFDSFYITTPHPLSIYTVTLCFFLLLLFVFVFFFYKWNVTFKLLKSYLVHFPYTVRTSSTSIVVPSRLWCHG